MSDNDFDTDGLRERITKQGEDTLGKMADDLLANPLVSGAISRAFEAREKASSVQEATLAALNLPSAADIERLTRRVRSVSQRLEGIEDGIDRIDERVAALATSAGAPSPLEGRLDAIEDRLEALMRELVALRSELPGATEPVPSRQERLKVSS
jgi:predicted  nucleic acid-binding Zn-ribbon protein